MQKRIIDIDPLSRVETWHHYNPLTDETTIEEVQDVSPWLKQNNELKKDDDYSKKGIKNDWWHYASIPNALITKFAVEHGIDVFNKDHSKAVMKLLNTEYTALKATRGYHNK